MVLRAAFLVRDVPSRGSRSETGHKVDLRVWNAASQLGLLLHQGGQRDGVWVLGDIATILRIWCIADAGKLLARYYLRAAEMFAFCCHSFIKLLQACIEQVAFALIEAVYVHI